MDKKVYDQRKALGVCVVCAIPLLQNSPTIRCASCAQKKRDTQRESQRRIQDHRKQEGLCYACGKAPAFVAGGRCQECVKLARQRAARKETAYKQQGRCKLCGLPSDDGYKVCSPCRRKRLKYDVALRERYEQRNVCTACGRPKEVAGKMCELCRKKRKNHYQKRSQWCIDNGLCYECPVGQEKKALALGKRPLCFDCWLEASAKNRTGDPANAAILLRLWDQQNGRCAYTGVELIPGMNASVDHKVPVTRGGGNEESNLHWVEFRVNTMKYNQTHEEFLATCRLVVSRFPE